MSTFYDTGVYGRQSKNKNDSLSIDTQHNAGINLCKNNNWQYKLYKDEGYSGKNLKRPGFKELLDDIRAGIIKKVIVYRMDRISRSLLDFADLIKFFNEYDVQFISVTEQFDTSTPIGRAMVYIIMVFAQLERETIRDRVRDSWYARSMRGIWPGGIVPYGYMSDRRLIDGKMQSVLIPDPSTYDYVKLIFKLFVVENYSLNAVAHEMNDKNIPAPKSDRWTSNAIKLILRNLKYCPAVPAIYREFDKLGVNILSELEEFDGSGGAYYFGSKTGNGETLVINPYSDRYLIVGNYPPLITYDVYNAAQQKLNKNTNFRSEKSNMVSWLTGLIKCAECGYSMQSTRNKIHKIYYKCSGRANRGHDSCSNYRNYRVEELEDVIGNRINEHIKKLRIEDINDSPAQNNVHQDMKIIEIDKQINNLVDAIAQGSPAAPLNRRIADLELKRAQLLNNIPEPKRPDTMAIKNLLLSGAGDIWSIADLQEKHRIAKTLVSSITIDVDDHINIEFEI